MEREIERGALSAHFNLKFQSRIAASIHPHWQQAHAKMKPHIYHTLWLYKFHFVTCQCWHTAVQLNWYKLQYTCFSAASTPTIYQLTVGCVQFNMQCIIQARKFGFQYEMEHSEFCPIHPSPKAQLIFRKLTRGFWNVKGTFHAIQLNV